MHSDRENSSLVRCEAGYSVQDVRCGQYALFSAGLGKYTCAHNEINAFAATGVGWFLQQQYRVISALLRCAGQAGLYGILLLNIQ